MTQEDNQNDSGSQNANQKRSGGGKKRGKKKSRPHSDANQTTAREASVAPSEVSVAPVAADSSSGNSSNALPIIALLLSVLALGAAGYAWYQTAVNARLAGGEQTNRLENIENRFADVTSEQSGVAAQIDQIRDRVAGAESGLSEQVSEFRQQIANSETGVAEQISQVKQLVGNTESTLAEQISAIRTTVSDQQQKIAASVADAEQEVAAQTETFRNEFETLSASIGEVRGELGTSVDQWSRREVEHLLVIGNQRLGLGQDPVAAGEALRIADQRLQQMDDPALLDVRQQISAELASLESVNVPDLASAMGTLTLLSTSLEDLPLVGSTNVPAAAAVDGETDDGSSDESIADMGKSFFSGLGKLVQVEKGGAPVAPSITPEIERLVIARARLMLEGAQVALVRTLPDVYRSRIDAADGWVRENFDTESDLTQNWLSQLEAVKGEAPEVSLPEISGSLTALREVMSAEEQAQ